MDLFTSQELRDQGIKQSIDHANLVLDKWSDKAYLFLIYYIKYRNEFMAEDVRRASERRLPEPPSKRAWGAIIVRAKKNGLIYRKGFKSVKNPKAHCTPATLWGVIANIEVV